MKPKLQALLMSEIVLTTEQLKSVGCLAIESTRLETIVEIFIVKHLGSDLGEFVVQDKMLGGKVDLFKTVFAREASNDKETKELERWYGEVKSDISRRNAVIHGNWKRDDLVNSAGLRTWPDSKSNATAYKKAMKVNASDVMELAKRFSQYQARLIAWYLKVVMKNDAFRDISL